ncbi:MAG: response regulator transcription factor [Pseudomonadota bacterium]
MRLNSGIDPYMNVSISSDAGRNIRKFQPDDWAIIIDDHPMFCDALELTLRSICEFRAVQVANSLNEGLRAIGDSATRPGLVVLDLNMPDVTGFDGLLRVLKAAGSAPVIVVSSLTDNNVVASALQMGASGYVPKHSPRNTFRRAIDAIETGEIFAPDNFVPVDAVDRQRDAVHAIASLTPQQARILELICDGMLNKQIAFELSIAEATVKAHVTAIMRKLDVHNRTQAVLVANDARFNSMLQESTSHV